MIADLKKYCGLDIKLDTDKPSLVFGESLNFSKATVRTLDEMQEVLLDKTIQRPKELYYMYRDVYISDKSLLERNKLRYDVTLIKPDCLGKELMKTQGHYHPDNFGELYEVVYGSCFCLLQRPNLKDHQIIEEVVLVKAKAGEKILIPPGFGHILINPGPDYLVTSNWVSSSFASEYYLYKKAGGAAYFVIHSQDEGLEFISNPYFKQLAKIRFVSPASRIDKFGLAENNPIYSLINQDTRKLDFLNRPLDFNYTDIFIDVSKEQFKVK